MLFIGHGERKEIVDREDQEVLKRDDTPSEFKQPIGEYIVRSLEQENLPPQEIEESNTEQNRE